VKKLPIILSTFILLAFFVQSCTNEGTEPTVSIEEAPFTSVNSNCDVNGEDCMNSGGMATYTYTSNEPVSTINWLVISGNISIISGQGTQSVTVQAGSGFTGAELKADVVFTNGNDCDASFIIDKCIPEPCPVPPRPGLILNNQGVGSVAHTICANELDDTDFSIGYVTGADFYEWRVTPSTGVTYQTEDYDHIFEFFSAPAGSYSLEVRGVNECGAGPWSGAVITVEDCGGFGGGF